MIAPAEPSAQDAKPASESATHREATNLATKKPINTGPKTVSGKSVLVFSAVFLGLLVPLATWGTYLWVVSNKPPVTALAWNDHRTWHPLPMKPAALLKSGFLTPPKQGVYNELPLPFSESELEAIRADTHAAAIDAQTGDWQTATTWPENMPDDAAWPRLFLKAQWLKTQGQTEAAEALFQTVYRKAPRAACLQIVGPNQKPLANVSLGTLVFTLARTDGAGKLDETIKVMVTDATTDANGQIWLPVGDTPVRLDVEPKTPDWQVQWFGNGYYDFPSQTGVWPWVTFTPLGETPPERQP